MTLAAAAAAAAVPLVFTLFTEPLQHFPSKRAPAQMPLPTGARASWLVFFFFFSQTHPKGSALIFNAVPDPGSDLNWSVPPSRSLIHEIMQLFLSRGGTSGIQPLSTVTETRRTEKGGKQTKLLNRRVLSHY